MPTAGDGRTTIRTRAIDRRERRRWTLGDVIYEFFDLLTERIFFWR